MGVIPDHRPHGTLDELLAIKANPAKIGSCHRRIKEDGRIEILGCSVRRACELLEKDGRGPATSGLNGAGPCNKGVEFFKKSPPNNKEGETIVGRVVVPCYDIPGFTTRMEINGGMVRVIAGEGEKIRLRGSLAEDQSDPSAPGGMRRVITDVIHEETVPKFPRPGERWNLAEHQLVAEAVEDERARRRAEQPGKLLGLKPEGEGGTPQSRESIA